MVCGVHVRGVGGRVLQVAAAALLFALFTGETLGWGKWGPPGEGTRQESLFRAEVWTSVAWAAYAAALLVVGFLRARADLRWCAIGLFGLTLGKVFLNDMARLDAVYRIGSFLVLGLLLVGASFLYQRRRSGEADGG